MMRAHRTDLEVLAGALRDVVGADAEQPLREGPQSVARLVRWLLASPSSARKLVEAFTARSVDSCPEKEPPQEFGAVKTDYGAYDGPPLMFDPMGSPEFEAAIDSMVRFDEQQKWAQWQDASHWNTGLTAQIDI
jgi:hypothetical protein